uniref:Ig-like domain-containing protein n=1 Tax=Vombatus ursinus TaxID=29139 RepID=A0A4X2KAB8_VOMUR
MRRTDTSEAGLSPVPGMLLLVALIWEGCLCQITRYEVQRQPTVIVQEGMCARVPCNISSHLEHIPKVSPGHGYWFRKRMHKKYDDLVATNDPNREVEEEVWGRFRLLGSPGMANCSLSITDAKKADSGQYYFWMEREGQMNYTHVKLVLYVNVTDLIQKPDISIPEMLESGNPVTVKCTFPWTCGENRPFKFSWKGAALSSRPQSSGASHSSEVSFIPGHQHHDTNLTCKVTLPEGRVSTERTVQLNVSYAVQNVAISMAQDNRKTVFVPGNSSALVVQEGRSLHLLCAANSNPPATLSWLLGDQTLASSQPSEDGVLHLDLPHLGPADGGNYTCLAEHALGSKQASLSVSVQYSPRMLSSSCSWVKEGLLCTCSAQAEPAPSLHWWVGGKPVESNGSSDTFQVISNRSGPWASSILSVKVGRVPNINISCEGKNSQGSHTFLFQLVPDGPMPSHVFQKGMILGVLCGAGTASLVALFLLLL